MLNLKQTTLVAFLLLMLIAVNQAFFPAIFGQTPPPVKEEPVKLELNKPLERELSGESAHRYTVKLAKGQFLHVIVDQRGIDIVLSLFAPNDEKLKEIDSPNGTQGPEPLTFIAETDGDYVVEVRSPEKAAPGHYGILMPELRPANEKDRKAIEALKIFNEGEKLQAQGTEESVRAAIDKFKSSNILFQALGDKNGQAVSDGYLGLIYQHLGDNQKALDAQLQALPLVRQLGDKDDEAATLNNIGSIYLALGDPRTALKYMLEILPVVREVKDRYGEGTTLNNIGMLYVKLHDEKTGLKYLNEALPVRKEVGDRKGVAASLNNISLIYKELNEPQTALRYLNESLPIRRAIGDKAGEAITLDNIGSIYLDLKDYEQTVKYLNESYPLDKLTGDPSLETTNLNNLMKVWEIRQNPGFAVFYGKQAVNAYQRMRANIRGLDKNLQQTFLKSIESSYRQLAGILIKQGRYPEAQQILNSFKDQQYFDFSQNKSLTTIALTPHEEKISAALDEKTTRLNTLMRQNMKLKSAVAKRQPTETEAKTIGESDAELQKAQDDYRTFVKSLANEFARPAPEQDSIAETGDLKLMQDVLQQLSVATKEPTVAIYTLADENSYNALLITPENISAVSVPVKGDELNKKALQLWSLLESPKYDPRDLSARLYDIIFRQISEKLPPDTKTILWSLDGNLRYVPMAALFDGKKYLVERYQNVVFTRADQNQLIREAPAELTGTGFGSSQPHLVEFLGSKFTASALPFVKSELAGIFKEANSNGAIDGEVLLNEKFNKTSIISALRKHRPLVHIASHFKFEPGDESRSFLLMGDGSPLTLDEMKSHPDLFSGVELLSLSACQTAAQQADANGREVDGFAELAQRLGANSVMASLWAVADDSTSELMQSFYRAYSSQNQFNKADALRSAQLELLYGSGKRGAKSRRDLTILHTSEVKIENYKLKLFRNNPQTPFAHPYYWSPFILIGNWR